LRLGGVCIVVLGVLGARDRRNNTTSKRKQSIALVPAGVR